MGLTSDQAGELLRARGLRSTPQRRAILGAFHGGRSEHLSADEVYARAARSLPDLSRGTVYSTLAEFNELGLLGSVGAPEPVRYETNTLDHPHFRCRLCLRLFDLTSGSQNLAEITDPGFSVERIDTRAEGVCADCNDYATGLDAGAGAIKRSGATTDTLSPAGTAAAQTDGPLGSVILAATPQGLTRVAFESHGDFPALLDHASRGRGGHAARRHLARAVAELGDYFAGEAQTFEGAVDWSFLGAAATSALTAVQLIPYATHRSYTELGGTATARELGWIMGANPIPIIAPCHRVHQGLEVPSIFVGGAARRTWLDQHELTMPANKSDR